MGLAERRATQDFQTNELPKLQAQVEEAAGFAVPVEVHWDGLAPEGESHLYKESWPVVYFEPLVSALKSIARDDMGRDALKTKLRQVVIQNSDGRYYPDNWAKFEGGVLTLDHHPITNAQDSQQRAAKLVQVLETGL